VTLQSAEGSQQRQGSIFETLEAELAERTLPTGTELPPGLLGGYLGTSATSARPTAARLTRTAPIFLMR
jgi:hypothetical protein